MIARLHCWPKVNFLASITNLKLPIKRNKAINFQNDEERERFIKRFMIPPPDFQAALLGSGSLEDNKSDRTSLSIYETKEGSRQNYVSRVKRTITQEIRKYRALRLPYNLKNRARTFDSSMLAWFRKKRDYNFIRYENIPKQTWETILASGARTFSPEAIPLAVKMCRFIPNKYNVYESLPASSNIELLKVPNFLHLTPTIVKKQCDQLKSITYSLDGGFNKSIALLELMNKWPDNLPHLPLGIRYNNYVFANINPEHPASREVSVEVNIDDLRLSDIQKLKLILLSCNCYDIVTNRISIEATECPTRSQNIQYAQYRLAKIVLEAKNITEEDRTNLDVENYERTKIELVSELIRNFEKPPNDNDLPYSRKTSEYVTIFNKVGYPFFREMKKLGIVNPYTLKDVRNEVSFLGDQADYSKYPTKALVRECFDPKTMVRLESGSYAKILKKASELVIK